MQRLILMALLCLTQSMFAQEQTELKSKNEIGLQLNSTDFLGTNYILNYTRHLDDKLSLQFSAGGNKGNYGTSYIASFGFRRLLFKHKNFEMRTGMDLSYQHRTIDYDFPSSVRPFGVHHQVYLDIPIQLSYDITKSIQINTSIKRGINIFDKDNGFGGNSINRESFNIGIAKRF